MKKSLQTLFMLVLVMTASAIVAKAQLQRGNVLIGGDIAKFQIGLTTGAKSTFDVLPKAAWFVKDNLALGGYAKLGYATAKGQGSDFSYGVGGLGRLYAGGNAVPAVNHTRLFVEANFGIEGVNHSVSSTNTTTNGIGYGVGPGIAYFITPNIGLEGLLKYDGVSGFGTSGNASTLDFNFGFQVYLPGRTVRSAATNSR